MSRESPTITIGTTAYTEGGAEIGTVRSVDTGGFFVTTREGIESLSIEHERAGGPRARRGRTAVTLWRLRRGGQSEGRRVRDLLLV